MKYVVNVGDILHNLEVVKAQAGVPVIGVVKGNGYGFGQGFMAKLLKDNGITQFAVTEVHEAQALRETVLTAPEDEILLLRSTCIPEEAKIIADIGATATIGSAESARVLNDYCREAGIRCKAHVKIDTGMGRYGFLPDQIAEITEVYKASDCIDFAGIYTHFSSAFTNQKRTKEQYDLFISVCEKLQHTGLELGTKHCANSSALFNSPYTKLDAVRVGSALTGRIIGEQAKKLRRVGVLSVPVVEVKDLPKGHTVGYNGHSKTKRPTRIAVIPAGHTDGFGLGREEDIFRISDMLHRMLSDLKTVVTRRRTMVEIGGKRVPIIGQIGLSHTAVDITGLNIQPGDEALLDTSPLNINPLIPREYVTSADGEG